MATQIFKISINNAKFPFLYRNASRSVVQPQLDPQGRLPFSFLGNAANADYNVVQVVYMENVVPTVDGIASVKYVERVPGLFGAVTFDRFFVIRDSAENQYLLGVTDTNAYIYDPATEDWNTSILWASDAFDQVSVYSVDGESYFLAQGYSALQFNPAGPTWSGISFVLPDDLTMSDIVVGCAASNYAVLATKSEILWSTLTDRKDFADIDLGAGRQTPVDIKGQIRALVPIAGGFIIYTTKNAVAAYFTNRSPGPFLFKEVLGSNGIASSEHVTGDANMQEHYTYGQAGIQRVSLQRAETIFPDCADFLSGGAYDVWNNTTHLVQQVNQKQTKVRIYLALARYLVVSFAHDGTRFTQALLFDISLERWGRLKINHADVGVLPWLSEEGIVGAPLLISELTSAISSYSAPISELKSSTTGQVTDLTLYNWRETLAFMDIDGTMYGVEVETEGLTNASGIGVVVAGRCQVVRGRMVTLQEICADGVHDADAYVLTSDPGNGYARDDSHAATLTTDLVGYKAYRKRVTAENFDVALVGSFMLTNLIVETTVHGSR